MVNFPVFTHLDIDGYGLYPGPDGEGVHLDFRAGLTLLLGANGLGKTTLVTLIYRMITGPWDIPALAEQGELGNAKLNATRLPTSARRMFAARVADGADAAKAVLKIRLGATQVVIERRLSDLAVVSLSIGGTPCELDEAAYQKEISRLVGVWSFGDVILILRHLVFYFEDRRALVWDPSAQRQLLRALFLPQTTAKRWTEWERSILQLDSAFRNLGAAMYREEQALAKNDSKVEGGENVRAELKTLQRLQKSDQKRREKIEAALNASEAARAAARLKLLKSQQARDGYFRDLERAKLTAINARFPSRSDTAKYILAQLMTDGECLACGHHSPLGAKSLEKRISKNQCVICGTALDAVPLGPKETAIADKRVAKTHHSFGAADKEVTANTEASEEIQKEHDQLTVAFATLDAEMIARSSRIEALVRQLPLEEVELHQAQGELATMRARHNLLKDQLDKERNQFSGFVKNQNRALVKFSEAVIEHFQDYAQGFLFERCLLTWSPQGALLGQGGARIDFPAYELDMSGADFAEPRRREGPEQVSESQREFIDLAFRMALIEQAGSDSTGSMIMDAPESSLDAIFVQRAVAVLGKFANARRKNRLIIASNLVEGDLIPKLVGLTASDNQIVNMLEIATPTAAVRKNKDPYDKLFRRLTRR